MMRRKGNKRQANDRAAHGQSEQMRRPKTPLQTRGSETHDRHHQQEESKDCRRTRRGKTITVDHRQVQPVVSGAFQKSSAHHHESNQNRATLAPRQAGQALLRAACRGLVPFAHEAVFCGFKSSALVLTEVEANGNTTDNKLKNSKTIKVRSEWNSDPRGKCSKQCATEHANRVHRLNHRNDEASDSSLNQASLDIHARSPQARPSGHENEGSGKEHERIRKRSRRCSGDTQCPDRYTDAPRPTCADLHDDRAGSGKRQQRAQGGNQEHHADGSRSQSQVVTHIWQTREPC